MVPLEIERSGQTWIRFRGEWTLHVGGRWNVVGERDKSREKLLDSGSDTALWGGLIPELGNKLRTSRYRSSLVFITILDRW